MKTGFSVIICLIGSVQCFLVAARFRRFKVTEKAPASRAHLSVEQRQKKIRIASKLSLACGCLMLAGAIYLTWLSHSP
jgi:hypothetical protein